jgi:hypothetical protein
MDPHRSDDLFLKKREGAHSIIFQKLLGCNNGLETMCSEGFDSRLLAQER